MRISSLASLAVGAAFLVIPGVLSRAEASESAAPQFGLAADVEGYVIDIPGIGPIPIPLPPGSQVFGPRGPAPQPRPAGPPKSLRPKEHASARNSAGGLEGLFSRLAATVNADEARAIAASIQRVWARSGSDTADLLATRAGIAEKFGDHGLAKELLDYVLALKPHWAEALVRRSNVRAGLGDFAGALADLEQAVRIEPRRFDAFTALGALEEANGRKKSALEAYRRSLEIDPMQSEVLKAAERLQFEVEGRDI
jgi:tetratricopeptide (TPR) repeat protein